MRLERAIAEHMLRHGRRDSARALAEEAGLAELVDAEVASARRGSRRRCAAAARLRAGARVVL